MKRRILILILAMIAGSICAQTGNDSDSLKYGALKVFFDCDYCDEDHIRREVNYVNYMRDRKEAEVHVLITSQRTGSGGRAYTFTFIGQNGFDGLNDTLVFNRMTDDTDELVRAGQIKTLKMGLMRYVARTPIASEIDIRYSGKTNDFVEDKWRSWVFSTSFGFDLQGEKSSRRLRTNAWISANKITPDWKFDFDYFTWISENKYITEEEGTIYGTRISHSAYVLLVKSLSDHWSAGGSTSLSSSLYSNYRLAYSFMPGIEYDLFPYYESTRRQLRFLYTNGVTYNDYNDTTIYNKTEELLWGHQFEIAYEITQKWGSIEIDLGWQNYFNDWSKNSLMLRSEYEIRITKGLELRLDLGVSLIHNQLNLEKGGASTEDMLLQVKELETSYNYEFDISLSYTFGAIYNNVVNPRFGRGRRYYYYH